MFKKRTQLQLTEFFTIFVNQVRSYDVMTVVSRIIIGMCLKHPHVPIKILIFGTSVSVIILQEKTT